MGRARNVGGSLGFDNGGVAYASIEVAPSIFPGGEDETVYLVLDNFGHLGLSWRETGVNATDLEAVITDLLEGQYNNPVRVIGFNTAEG